ncbi:cystatin domain-containing protein [Chitinilyticum piscinae]|uniref:2-oxoglutarate dehydrogenase n=1 Tax=Chitinilyticum piscinae TaxID=2866724 RepID=A0A8J7FKC8_9NEIS|nr:cystatin domain-containing protein [Chitinilyticum piscinae]MBE9609282.1 2-oxoglutarate dehydrogenase [Chitinilyticum piscinae]
MHRILAMLFSATFLAACAQATPPASPPASCPPSAGVGGYSQQQTVSTEAREAVQAALQQLNTTATLQKILEVRTQVVAGTNYAVKFQLDNGEVWHAVVWRKLDGHYQVTQRASKAPVSPFCPGKQ